MAWTARADVVSGTGGAGYQSWDAADADENGSPYWDASSLDGPSLNIGFLANAPGGPGSVPFWSFPFDSITDSGGAPDENITFLRTSNFTSVTLQLEIAALADVNEFGWYDVANPGILNPIFGGSAEAGATAEAQFSNNYGFYIRNDGGTFYSQSSLNPVGDTTHQHFAVFQEVSSPGTEVYWLGIEDLSVKSLSGREGGVGDFNDMVVRLEGGPIPVPELSSWALLAGGFGLMLWRIRKRSKRPIKPEMPDVHPAL